MNDWTKQSPWGGVRLRRSSAAVVRTFLRLGLYEQSPDEEDRQLAALIRELDLEWSQIMLLMNRLKDPRKKRGRKDKRAEEDRAIADLRERLGREPLLSEVAAELASPMTGVPSIERRLRRRQAADKNRA